MHPRKEEVAIFRLWPSSCRHSTPITDEQRHHRHVEAHVVRGTGGHAHKIQCVEYAVNPALEQAYILTKEEMTRRLGSAGVNECFLFHGTSFANSEAILRENFRLDKVGAEGRVPTPLIHLTSCSATRLHVSDALCESAWPSFYTRKVYFSRRGAGRKPGSLVPSYKPGSVNRSLSSKHLTYMCTRPGLTAGGFVAWSEACVWTLPPRWEAQRTGGGTAEAYTSPTRVVIAAATHSAMTAADCSSSKYSSVG